MPEPLEFTVEGVPVPQGSMIARLDKHGRPYVAHADPAPLKAWRGKVATIATSLLQWRSAWPKDSPVDVHLLFEMQRGVTVTRPRPSARKGGDIDKLTRAILDALQIAGVYVDDAQVVGMHVYQYYSPTPGVRIRVEDADPRPPLPIRVRAQLTSESLW